MKKTLTALALGLVMAGAQASGVSPNTNPSTSSIVIQPQGSCRLQDYAGTRLVLCIQLCEKPYAYTWQQREAFLRIWLSAYRDLPFCML